MKKQLSEQSIEMWITRGRNGQLIRVYQMNNFDLDQRVTQSDPLTIPICVDYMSYSESIVDILEERDSLKDKVIKIENEHKNKYDSRLDRLENKIFPKYEYKAKKWYQFWKKF